LGIDRDNFAEALFQNMIGYGSLRWCHRRAEIQRGFTAKKGRYQRCGPEFSSHFELAIQVKTCRGFFLIRIFNALAPGFFCFFGG
jgi:hypothetical protein